MRRPRVMPRALRPPPMTFAASTFQGYFTAVASMMAALDPMRISHETQLYSLPFTVAMIRTPARSRRWR